LDLVSRIKALYNQTMTEDTKDDLISRLEDLEDVAFDDETSEIEDLIDSGDFDDAESLIGDLESERL